MRAIVYERYGPPDVLESRELEVPEIGDDGVLVRVRASSVNPADWHTIRGRPYFARLITGVRRPKETRTGTDVAGVVEAVGKDVHELRPGQEVFGTRDGAYAEYVAGRVRNFAPKPGTLTFEQAAALPVAATTALQGLRDKAQLRPGETVLILGAGGGVGTFAVQLAKAMGGRVTAVTSARMAETVRSLGADEVIDYAQEDVTKGGRRFDVILDVGGFRSTRALLRALAPAGRIVLVGAGDRSSLGHATRIAGAALRSRLRGQRVRSFLANTNRDDLLALAEFVNMGRLSPVIDRTYPLSQIADAVRYVETGQARGKVVVTVP